MRLQGVHVAIVTPFTDGFEVDREGLRRHAAWLVSKGVHGIVATGTCGEYLSLTMDERRAVVETILEVGRGKVPVTVGVTAPTTAQAAGWAEHARDHGADAVMALPPINYRPSWREVLAYYAAIDAVGLPVVVYNNPHDTAVDVTPERLAELETLPNIRAVKEFSGDVRRVTALRAACRSDVVAGADDLVLESLLAGASGWIAGMANIVPEASVELYELVERGELEAAWSLYRKMLPLLRYDTGPTLVQAIKYGLEAIGRPVGPTRPPRLRLETRDTERIDEVLSALGVLVNRIP